jgi:hypothetical protein
MEILHTHFSVQIMKKGNNPALQLDWSTASQTPNAGYSDRKELLRLQFDGDKPV